MGGIAGCSLRPLVGSCSPVLQCGFGAPLAAAIAKAGYQQPTAIQAQALPAALSGRDVLVGSQGLGDGRWGGVGAGQADGGR